VDARSPSLDGPIQAHFCRCFGCRAPGLRTWLDEPRRSLVRSAMRYKALRPMCSDGWGSPCRKSLAGVGQCQAGAAELVCGWSDERAEAKDMSGAGPLSRQLGISGRSRTPLVCVTTAIILRRRLDRKGDLGGSGCSWIVAAVALGAKERGEEYCEPRGPAEADI